MNNCEASTLCLAVILFVVGWSHLKADESDILTRKEAPEPQLHSAKVFGVRPNAPFLFTLAATGTRPMTFATEGLPTGLKLDAQTGQISGVLATKGDYEVRVKATNSLGSAVGKWKIVCGSQIGLTPAMGWNS